MYRVTMRFSLMTALLCLVFAPDTMAAPSIRKLGSLGASGTKATSVKSTATKVATDTDTTAKKAASVKVGNTTDATGQSLSRLSSNRIGTLGGKPITKGTTLTGIEGRFPSVSVKTGKIQTINKPTVVTEPTKTDEMMEKISNLEIGLNGKVDTTELQNNYYTKEQINTGFYGTGYIDSKVLELTNKIDALDAINPSNLVNTVEGHTESINILNGNITKVYDNETDKYVDVSIVTEFDESILSSN